MKNFAGKAGLLAGALIILMGIFLFPGQALAAQKKVKVTFDANGGTVSEETKILKRNEKYGKLPLAERKGYTFQGWYTQQDGGKKVKAKTVVTDKKPYTLYAHWKINKYKVKYYYNGGKLSDGQKNAKSYTVEKKVKLLSPEKKGFEFAGWYTSKKFLENTRVKSIKKGTVGNLKLYAKYEPITYTINFSKNGLVKSVPASITYTYGTKIKLPGCDDEEFGSWNTKADGSGKQYKAGAKMKNLTGSNKTITLYANAFVGKNNIEKLYGYLQRKGFTKQAAAGIVGNLMYESGGGYSDIKLNAVEYRTGRGIGMCQWTDTKDAKRRTNFVNYCRSKGKNWPNQDLKLQVDFMIEELEGKHGVMWVFGASLGYPVSYKMTLAKFRKLKNVDKATRVFCANFERPYLQHANLTQRSLFAQYVYKTF